MLMGLGPNLVHWANICVFFCGSELGILSGHT
jgi:hypothetical protein